MQRQFIYSTVLAGVLSVSTLGLFYNGAQALDLGDFTGADRKVITQDAPKAGGIVLIKEDIVYPNARRSVTMRGSGPVLTATTSTASDLSTISPAAGNPDVDLDAHGDITLRPGNAYNQTQARFNTPGAAQPPVDGKPLVTTTAASGTRVPALNEIAPAAGGPAALPTIRANVQADQSVRAMTGARGQSEGYNN